jgi:hypothetical protein
LNKGETAGRVLQRVEAVLRLPWRTSASTRDRCLIEAVRSAGAPAGAAQARPVGQGIARPSCNARCLLRPPHGATPFALAQPALELLHALPIARGRARAHASVTLAAAHIRFISTYGSWLNRVELSLSRITDKAIRRGSLTSVKRLVRRIDHLVTVYNVN